MSALERLKKFATGEFDKDIEQLRENFQEMLQEIKVMNRTLKDILKELKEVRRDLKGG